MADSLAISVELGHLLPEGSTLDASLFPTLAFAVQKITEAAHQQWQAFAAGAALPGGGVIQNRSGEYLRSILMQRTGEFSGEVYSELPYAQAIEEGTAARDLKKMLASSMKVRLTKDGRRYLIIPFRHDNPNSVMGNAMPEPVMAWWNQGRATSHITSGGLNYRRRSGTGALDIKTHGPVMVPAWRYHWGSRLGKADLAGLGVTGKQAKRLQGMVHFRNPGSARSAHSQFITFRVMVEGSKGWIVPAKPGLFPAKATADLLRPVAEEAFQAAMQEDIARLVGGE